MGSPRSMSVDKVSLKKETDGGGQIRSRNHERAILLRFPGIILRGFSDFEVSVWITIGKGEWFSIRFSSFLLYCVL
jgi:hypothetical protein